MASRGTSTGVSKIKADSVLSPLPEVTIAELEEAVNNFTPTSRRWTTREFEIVRKYFGRVEMSELRKQLGGRTESSVRWAVRRLREQDITLECDK